MKMSSNAGYIAIHRKLRDNFLWKDRRVFSRAEAWIDILMEVRWTDSIDQVLIGNKLYDCGYGQSLNSSDTWARRWRWSPSKVQRFFKLLNEQGMLLLENVAVTTRITVCNFRDYQKSCSANEGCVTRTRRGRDAHVKAEEEGKEGKEVNKGNGSNGKYRAELPDFIDSATWENYRAHRIALNSKMTPNAEKLILGKLERLMKAGNPPKEVLEQSIERGWKGVFELKQDKKMVSTDPYEGWPNLTRRN